MDKIWVKDVKEGERVKSVFLVARKATPTAKSGKTYLSVTFQDRTGELEARAFDKVEELSGLLDEKDHVEVEGAVGAFQGKPQLRIESVARVDAATLDAAEFVWAPPPEPKKPERTGPSQAEQGLWGELLAMVDVVVDPHVKTLIMAFLEDDDVAARLRRAPAAKSVHHAYAGGLLEHTVSCLKLAHRIADHFPQVDRDLLVAGAFFHDLGKIRELSGDRGAEYTDEGRLVGHHVMTAQWIHDKARRVGASRDLEHHVVHMVLAHHGRLEYGSPKIPMTLEAMLTHAIDEIDSRVNSWLNLMGKEGGNRRWTDANNIHEQSIWRGTLPTVQAEKKGPPAELLTPVIYVPRDGAGPQGAGAPRKKQKEKRRPEPREARPAQAAAEAKPAEGGVETKPEAAAPARPEVRPERAERPERHDRPDRGGPGQRDQRGFGDKKRGYMGPRLPGDKGPHRPPEKKSLTHNPFAALAQKLEEAGKPVEPPEAPATEVAAEPAPAPAAPSESTPAVTPRVEPITAPESATPAETTGADAKQGG
jgi:3'-5' exoribonuclease